MKLRTVIASLVLASITLGSGALALESVILSHGPDRDIVFVREATSELDPAVIAKAEENLSNWPDWHFFLESAKRLDARGMPMPLTLQRIEVGAVLQLTFLPKGEKRRQFELVVEVTQYVPGRTLAVRLLEDRHGKLTALFTGLRWRVDIAPRADAAGSRLRVVLAARTNGARARVLAGLAERILMNQALYVDLIKLAEITQPHGVILTPSSQQ